MLVLFRLNYYWNTPGSAKCAKQNINFGLHICNLVNAWHWNGTLCLVQVDGMDVLAVKQACKFAKEHVLENGPIVSIWEVIMISVISIMWMHAYLRAHNSSRSRIVVRLEDTTSKMESFTGYKQIQISFCQLAWHLFSPLFSWIQFYFQNGQILCFVHLFSYYDYDRCNQMYSTIWLLDFNFIVSVQHFNWMSSGLFAFTLSSWVHLLPIGSSLLAYVTVYRFAFCFWHFFIMFYSTCKSRMQYFV